MAIEQFAHELAKSVQQVHRQEHKPDYDSDEADGITSNNTGEVFAKAQAFEGVLAESVIFVNFVHIVQFVYSFILLVFCSAHSAFRSFADDIDERSEHQSAEAEAHDGRDNSGSAEEVDCEENSSDDENVFNHIRSVRLQVYFTRVLLIEHVCTIQFVQLGCGQFTVHCGKCVCQFASQLEVWLGPEFHVLLTVPLVPHELVALDIESDRSVLADSRVVPGYVAVERDIVRLHGHTGLAAVDKELGAVFGCQSPDNVVNCLHVCCLFVFDTVDDFAGLVHTVYAGNKKHCQVLVNFFLSLLVLISFPNGADDKLAQSDTIIGRYLMICQVVFKSFFKCVH